MIQGGIESLAGRRILLLQGPVGPFFWRLARSLKGLGAKVFKVNFNSGDWLYFPTNALNFRAPPVQWGTWLETLLQAQHIDLVLLFGDCRPLHSEARRIAFRRGIEVGVFEEGYIRPNYVTFERHGVNGNSLLHQFLDPEWKAPSPPPERPVGSTFSRMAWQAFGYSVANILGKAFFPHYRHHRPLGLAEGACWIRAAWRKWYWRYRERNVFRRLHEVEARRYFLAPLQVFNDAQVTAHGPVRNVSSFICQVAESFARHAPADTLLVFKHHPMDRGHTDYAPLIHQLSQSLGIADRILYVHDLHLPTLLQRTQGVVVINSTVGLSALCHGAATLTLGSAIFDLPGLTFQGSLDDFWRAARTARPAPEQVQRFKQYLIARTQINGSFYRALPGCDGRAGLAWAAYSNVPRPLKTAPQAEELAS